MWLKNGEADRKPYGLIIHALAPRRGQVVRACSIAARERGVRVDMPLSEAVGLFADERQLRLVEHDPQADLAALAKWAEHCERFSPLVGWRTISGGNREIDRELAPHGEPDALFLDVAGIERLFGGAAGLRQAILDDVARQGWVARIATADTVSAAWAETMLPKPQASGDGPREPGAIPVTALRMPNDAVTTLAALGVHRVDQLLQLPRAGLATRIGPAALLRLDQLLGQASESIACHRPAPVYTASWIAENPVEDREQIAEQVAQLLDRIASAMFQKQQGVLRLECRIDHEGASPARLDLGLFRSTSCPAHLFELLTLQLDRQQFAGPVGRIGIHVTTSAPLEFPQKELFAGNRSLAAADAARLIDRLRCRLGNDNVLQATTVADPLPERAVRWQSPKLKAEKRRKKKAGKTQTSAEQEPQATASAVPRLWGQRPLVLLPEPALLSATSIAPEGPPMMFAFRGERHRVRRHIGPERIETGWWRGPSIRRDYYRVETTSGVWFWLYRALDNGRWFLHGLFE